MHSFAWWPTLFVVMRGDLHGSAQPAHSELAGASFSGWLGIAVSGWLHGWHGIGAEPGGAGLGLLIFGVLFWMGGMGAGDVKLCAAIGAWIGPEQLLFALVLTGTGGRSDGSRLGGLWRISEGPVQGHGRSDVWLEENSGEADHIEQSAAAQDAVRAGHRHRNADLIFCSLKDERIRLWQVQRTYRSYEGSSTQSTAGRHAVRSDRTVTTDSSPLFGISVSRLDRRGGAVDCADRPRMRSAARRRSRPWPDRAGHEVREFPSYPAEPGRCAQDAGAALRRDHH